MDSITLQLFSIHNKPNYRGGNDVLSLFGRGTEGEALRVDVNGFRPYIYLEMTEKEFLEWWPCLCLLSVYGSLEKKFQDVNTQDEMCMLIMRRLRRPPPMPVITAESGFGIQEVTFGDTRPFIKLQFRNWPSLQKIKRTMQFYTSKVAEIMQPSSVLCNILEHRVGTQEEIDFLEPCLTKMEDNRVFEFKTYEGCFDCGSMFLIHYNVQPSSWLRISPVKVSGETITCIYNDLLTVVPGEGPAISRVRILSYDIEAVPFVVDSGNTLFPQPERDPICTIGIACYEYGTGNMELHALSVGETTGNWTRDDDVCRDDYDPSQVKLHTFLTEGHMLLFFSDFIRAYDPDFISGYNILNFDNFYTLKRAAYICNDGRAQQWGRTNDICVPEKRFTSSNQLGGREFWDVRIIGREWFDLYNICKVDHKLRSYKLDNVAESLLGTNKIHISYDDIPVMCKTPDGRKRLAVYCVKDAFLPLQICIKLCKLQNHVSLSYVTGAPLDHILNRGQQIRTLNLIVRYVRTHTPRLYVPDRSQENTDGFQGAVVIEPIKGFYQRPVAVLDFASLYPSTMIANNMCFSTKISREDAQREGLVQGEDFLAIRDFKREGDTFEFLDQPHDTCFLMKEKRPGVLPEILASLLSARKKEKKLMKKCAEGSIEYGVHNGNQLALKISANSVYGFTGASRGVLTDPEIASAVTRRGRAMTNEAAFVAETAFEDTRCVYGDSVAGRTPLLLKRDGKIIVERICDLKLGTTPTYTWTEKGWTKIQNIICHRLSPEKQMLRIFTHTGMVDCTSDHSLVNSDGHAMFPSSIVCGETALMQSFPTDWVGEVQTVDMDHTMETILCAPENDRRTFVDAYMLSSNLIFQNQIDAQRMLTLLKSIGHTVEVSYESSGYRLRIDNDVSEKPHNVVKKVIELPHEQFVYDLTTENHHFHAGIGNMIVHNTDSIFIELGESLCPTEGRNEREIIQRAQEVGEMMSERITKCFRAPNDLEYEKSFWPFLLKGKKKYAGQKHEPGKKVCMDIKGFECVRRDSAPFVSSSEKVIFAELVGKTNIHGSADYAKSIVHRLLNNKMNLSELTLCKNLTKPPDQYKSKSKPVHVELAIHLKKVLPETMAPKVGDRIDFVIRKGPEKQCKRGVQPCEIESGKYELDVRYYIESQLYNAFERIFELMDDMMATITITKCVTEDANYDMVESMLSAAFCGSFKDHSGIVIQETDSEEVKEEKKSLKTSMEEYNKELRTKLNKTKYTVFKLSEATPEGSYVPGETKIPVFSTITLSPLNESGTDEIIVETANLKSSIVHALNESDDKEITMKTVNITSTVVNRQLQWTYTYVNYIFHEYHVLLRKEKFAKRKEKERLRYERNLSKQRAKKRKREKEKIMKLKKIGARDIRGFFM